MRLGGRARDRHELRLARRPRASGSTSAAPTCRGAGARRRSPPPRRVSTIRPAYMTAMSSAISATTPRSWVMITIAIPSSRCSRSSSARIWAWTVTSSAVVGSSAISSLGSLASAIAIIARWRMPPENSCGYSSHAACRVGDPDEAEQLDRRARAPAPWRRRGGRAPPRSAGCRPCRRGAARTAGPGRSSRSRCPGSSAAPRRTASSRSRPSNRMRPEMRAPWSRVSPSVVSEATVLPEPDSPTMPERAAGVHLVGDPVDRVHDAVFGRELDAQVLHAQSSAAASWPARRAAHE